MNEFEKSPNLMNAALGLPPWAVHIRTMNNLNTLTAIVLAIVVGLAKSTGAGIAYFGIICCSMVTGRRHRGKTD